MAEKLNVDPESSTKCFQDWMLKDKEMDQKIKRQDLRIVQLECQNEQLLLKRQGINETLTEMKNSINKERSEKILYQSNAEDFRLKMQQIYEDGKKDEANLLKELQNLRMAYDKIEEELRVEKCAKEKLQRLHAVQIKDIQREHLTNITEMEIKLSSRDQRNLQQIVVFLNNEVENEKKKTVDSLKSKDKQIEKLQKINDEQMQSLSDLRAESLEISRRLETIAKEANGSNLGCTPRKKQWIDETINDSVDSAQEDSLQHNIN